MRYAQLISYIFTCKRYIITFVFITIIFIRLFINIIYMISRIDQCIFDMLSFKLNAKRHLSIKTHRYICTSDKSPELSYECQGHARLSLISGLAFRLVHRVVKTVLLVRREVGQQLTIRFT